MIHAIQISRIIILVIWAFFLGWLVTRGQTHLGRFLHPNLWWLVHCATLILLLFLAVNLRRGVALSHSGNFWLQWPAFFVLLVPLLYFFPAKQGGFNAATLAKRAIQTEEGLITGNISTPSTQGNDYPPPLDDKEAPTDISLTRLNMQPNDYLGKEIEVVCRSFVDERLPNDLFMCYRYLLTCCAADAMPVFIFIRHPEAKTIANDKWIRAKGTFSLLPHKQKNAPLLTTGAVEDVDEPAFPYLF